MKFRKALSILLLVAMLASLCAVTSFAEGKTGTYKGEAQGFGGTITAYVTLDNGTITDVILLGPDETIGKGSVAIEVMPAQIIEAQSTDVDGYSGATYSSNAIREAVDAALASDTQVEYQAAETEIAYTPGTYTGKGFGHNFYTTVEVTLTEDTIESVTVTEDKSDTAMSRATIEEIPARIVEAQSLNVDIVSGATQSCNGIIAAVADCIAQASSEDVVTALKAPRTTSVEPVDEEYTTDVVVVGGGGSGLMSATALMQKGYNVIVLEAADIVGGMANVCGGGSLSIGSEIQIADTEKVTYEDGEVEQLQEEYLTKMEDASGNNEDAYPLIEAYVDALDEYADWASEAGIVYSATSKTGVRLMNKGSRFDTVVENLEAAGNLILTGTRGTDLIMEDDAVAGVIATNSTGGTTTVHAKAVVLATGGFQANEELCEMAYGDTYDETYWENWFGSSRYQGDGIQMAWAAGAEVGPFVVQPHDSQIPEELHDDIEIATHMPTDYATAAYLPTTLWVNSDGVRFCNENVAAEQGAEAHGAEQIKVGICYTILDSETIEQLVSEGTTITGWMGTKETPLASLKDQLAAAEADGWAYSASSIEELAEKLGMDPAVLTETVETYNSYVASGEDAEFGKDPTCLTDTVEGETYYALAQTTRVLGVYGGLVVDEDMRVLREDGTAIDGLYAAGLDAGYFMGEVYSVTTVTAGFSICSGYMVGQGADKYLAE